MSKPGSFKKDFEPRAFGVMLAGAGALAFAMFEVVSRGIPFLIILAMRAV